MRRVGLWMVLVVVVGVLAACGAGTTSAPTARDIDVSKLPVNIDVKTAQALQRRADVVLIDVREQSEYDAGHIPNISLIPMNTVPSRLAEIPRDKTVVVTCRSGNRSNQVTQYLRQQGYDNVHNLEGGILAWEKAGLPVEK